jgi:hypothetical protein
MIANNWTPYIEPGDNASETDVNDRGTLAKALPAGKLADNAARRSEARRIASRCRQKSGRLSLSTKAVGKFVDCHCTEPLKPVMEGSKTVAIKI